MFEILDTRDLEKRLQELNKKLQKLKNQFNETCQSDELFSDSDMTELNEIKSLKEEIGSEWVHGIILVPEDDFEAYCQQFCEDIGDTPKDFPHYIVIDWKATAKNMREDYTETIFQNEVYLYRTD